ncbi:MAG: hypothetical protein WDW36_009213 [Sanguina aurantia]
MKKKKPAASDTSRDSLLNAAALQDDLVRRLQMPGAPKALPSITPGAGMTLAQRRGLIPSPPALLTPQEWSEVQVVSRLRQDSHRACAICREDFQLVAQILLSCSHVFHRACLSSFERFARVKCCPLCRAQHYQTRVISDGAEAHRHRCATRRAGAACWGRRRARRLRRHTPPRDPRLRKAWAAERLAEESRRLVAAVDEDMGDASLDSLFAELDASLAASRRLGDAMVMPLVRHLVGSSFASMQPAPQTHGHPARTAGPHPAPQTHSHRRSPEAPRSRVRWDLQGDDAHEGSPTPAAVPPVLDTRLHSASAALTDGRSASSASTSGTDTRRTDTRRTDTSGTDTSSTTAAALPPHAQPLRRTCPVARPLTLPPPGPASEHAPPVRHASRDSPATASQGPPPPPRSGPRGQPLRPGPGAPATAGPITSSSHTGSQARTRHRPKRPDTDSENQTLTQAVTATGSEPGPPPPPPCEPSQAQAGGSLGVDWPAVVALASGRGDAECPICLGELHRRGSAAIAWLSCSHCLHLECIAAFEAFELSSGGTPCCPVCRSGYQRRCF